jgi:hypothetical protein
VKSSFIAVLPLKSYISDGQAVVVGGGSIGFLHSGACTALRLVKRADRSWNTWGRVNRAIPVAAESGELCIDARDRGRHVYSDLAGPGEDRLTGM